MSDLGRQAEAILADTSMTLAEQAAALDALRTPAPQRKKAAPKRQLSMTEAQRIVALEFSARGWDHQIGHDVAEALVRGTRSVERLSRLAPSWKLARRHAPNRAQVRDAMAAILAAVDAAFPPGQGTS